MILTSFSSLRRLAAVLLLACGACGSAQAGLVTGNWDPAFGAFLPGLSWQARAELNVPNSCSAQADGVYATTVGGPCDQNLISVLNVWLRLYDTGFADPANFFENGGVSPNHSAVFDMQHPPSLGYTVSKVRVQSGQVVGFEAGRGDFLPLVLTPALAQTVVCMDPPDCTQLESFPSAAGGNLFGLTFGVNGPLLECTHCRADINDPFGAESVFATTETLNQFLVTFLDNEGTQPKLTDGQGNALGARLDGNGTLLGFSRTPDGALIPEPGLPALALAAGVALYLTRRRQT